MKKSLIFYFAFTLSSIVSAQTMLSGIVNVYSGLLGQDDCQNTIELNNSADFVEGMGILIIQINGASIQTGNNENFGNITDLGGAGLYEYNRISQIDGQTITLENSIQNTYSPTNSQVVGFQILDNAIISGEVSAPAWNGTTGGIVVIEAENSIQVQSNINVNGLGFRGGSSYQAVDDNCNFLTNSNDFSYNTGNWRGAPKGEGIAAFVNGAENGRGAQANGGGGGNSHNSGGGGGGLLSAGGIGGINDEPDFLGCDGNFPGRGGKVIPNSNSRIFFGGGGGTGHSNNSLETRGGTGGGIIILKSDDVIFANGSLVANGLNGSSILGDGAGGGGAGGSILISASTITGNTSIEITGGAGGDANNSNENRCFGPGGGGSGGFLATGLAVAVNSNGGLAGQTINSTACSGSNGATNGENGILSSDFSGLIQGSMFTVPSIVLQPPLDTFICAGNLLELIAIAEGENLSYQWQILDGDWINLSEGGTYSGTQSSSLTFLAEPTEAGTYRLLITPENNCFIPLTSSLAEVIVGSLPVANPSFTIDGFDVEFMANIGNADLVLWTFLENVTSSETNPIFTFPGTGMYEVTFEAFTDCGQISSNLIINISTPLTAQFSASSLNGCAPFTVLFTDTSVGQVDNRLWTFEGGTPINSTEESQLVTFENIGSFDVSLTVENQSSSNITSNTINVLPTPLPFFTYEADQLQVSFTNSSSNADGYSWNFGDGEMSNTASPIHTYTSSGTYVVTLNATNEFCGTSISETISVNITDIKDLSASEFELFPNPAEDISFIQGPDEGFYKLYDINGQVVLKGTLTPSISTLQLDQLTPGLYFIVIYTPGKEFRSKLIKTN